MDDPMAASSVQYSVAPTDTQKADLSDYVSAVQMVQSSAHSLDMTKVDTSDAATVTHSADPMEPSTVHPMDAYWVVSLDDQTAAQKVLS